MLTEQEKLLNAYFPKLHLVEYPPNRLRILYELEHLHGGENAETRRALQAAIRRLERVTLRN
jgi:hypothetical protein